MAALATAALILVLDGCGGGGEANGGGTAPDGAAAAKARAAATARCLNQVGGFLGSLDRLRDQLVAGVNYTQYIEELNDVRAAYRRLPVKRLRLGCLQRAGTPGEQALNRYIGAAEIWSDCVEVPSCPSSSIEAKLRRKWRQGSRLLSEAEAGLSNR